MNTIRAIVVDPDMKGRLALHEVESPSPASSEVLVRVSAISLNLGEVRTAVLRTPEAGWRPGWDLAGVVVQAAADGSGPSVGARVFGLVNSGAWAELVAVPTASLAEIPEGVTFAQAATLPVAALTALYGLERAGFLLNRKVLVTGASGGVGHFACQLARQGGAMVVALVRRVERVASARAIGAHEVVVGEDVALARSFGPYDIVIDTLGGKSLSTALTLLETDGVCVNVGAAGDPEATLQSRLEAAKKGPFLVPEIERMLNAAKDLGRLAQMVAEERLHPQIGLEASWTKVTEVAQSLLDRRIAGKAILYVS
ncbi:oxidoreductase [Ktedonobacter sp. SOSP1-52]|uniref:zinc-binding dehydrogenase n=1 Tax=Ktedonobacter sp. SOSP1-52 TaxID=2778366 RepID=UPI001915FC1F|nr:zinc-binding dehydrogenase [Ktedonobacter sp. SOSP1-52]GHO70370.1 oxidoreductase [Ktedonobacter sp. SOSP1-52]